MEGQAGLVGGESRALDAEFFHQLIEGGAADTEVIGGATDFAVAAFEGLDDQVTFQLFAGFLKGGGGSG